MSNKDGSANYEHHIALNVEHAKAAYANAQDVIKFVDTKTGVLTGVLTITTGIPLAIFHFVVSQKSEEAATIFRWLHQSGAIAKILVYVSATTMCLGFVFGVISLLAATSGLMARRPRTASHSEDSLGREIGRALVRTITFGRKGNPRLESPEAPLTCLFPLFPPRRKSEAIENFRRLAEGKYTPEHVLREYASQVESVGSVLETKINRNRKAVRFFEAQIVAYMVSSVLSVVLVIGYPDSPGRKSERDRRPRHAHQWASYCAFC